MLTLYVVKPGMNTPYPEGTPFVYSPTHNIGLQIISRIGTEHIEYHFSNGLFINPNTLTQCCSFKGNLFTDLTKQIEAVAERLKPLLAAQRDLSHAFTSGINTGAISKELIQLPLK